MTAKRASDNTNSKFPGVNVVTKGDVKYYYHRATKKPLGKDYGSPEFVTKYNDAERVRLTGTAPPPPPNAEPIWRVIWNAYETSPEFTDELGDKSKSREMSYALKLQERWGWMTRADVEREEIMGDIYELRDEWARKGHRRTADAYVGLVSKLLRFAKSRRIISRNHVAEDGGVKRLYRTGQRAEIIHSPEMRAAFLAAAPRWEGLSDAYLVALFTGARVSDMIEWPEDAYDGEWLAWTPSKTEDSTGAEVHLPVFALPPLRDALARMPKGTGHLVARMHGSEPRKWAYSTLHKQWTKCAKLAGIADDLHWNDLRGTLLSMLAEAGCTDAERAAVSGHSMFGGVGEDNTPVAKSLGHYTARTRRLTLNAYTKLAKYLDTPEAGENVVPMRRRKR